MRRCQTFVARVCLRRCVSTHVGPITKRAVNFAQWYLDTIAAADLVDQSPVRGCMILKPRGLAIWDAIKRELDRDIVATGHHNAYFPLLVPLSFLGKEAEHIDGFAKECAVVTHHRVRKRKVPAGANPTAALEPDPAARLRDPLVIRPTSETIIWDAFRRWVSTQKDLPILINQWANVMRWEMRTRPFLRTSEFLWQEGHTAHATEGEAKAEAAAMLEMYRSFIEEHLALPVITGAKSSTERFAGAVDTLTCEAMMQNGWALQSATSHFLGTNFAKAFDVQFADATGARRHVWATSWGASTRLVGATIMAHGDDVGLVLPPAIAPVQVAVVPIVAKASAAREAEIVALAHTVAHALRGNGSVSGSIPLHVSLQQQAAVAAFSCRRQPTAAAAGSSSHCRAGLPPLLRVAVDTDLRTPPGQRFFNWERAGVPLRIEVGDRDLQVLAVVCKPRVPLSPQLLAQPPLLGLVSGAGKITLPVDSQLPGRVLALLQAVQAQLFADARARLHANLVPALTAEAIARATASASAAPDDADDAAAADAPAAVVAGSGKTPVPSALSSAPANGRSLGGKAASGAKSHAASPVSSLGASDGGASSDRGCVSSPFLLVPLVDEGALTEAALQALAPKFAIRCFPSPPAAAELIAAVAAAMSAGSAVTGAAAAGGGGGESTLAALQAAAAGRGVCALTGAPSARLALLARAF